MFVLKMQTGNAAFCNTDGEEDIVCESMEIARLLRKVADSIEDSTAMSGSANDINGNKVLTWERN